VADNLAERFSIEVQIREAKMFYDLQKTMENIHNETYALLVDTLVPNRVEQAELFSAIDTIPCIAKKAAWARQWTTSNSPFAERLVAFAVVEGVFFSGSFAAIFWLKKRGILPGLCVANTLIARDEGMHQQFATALYRENLEHKLPKERIYEIVRDAVEHEIEFVTDALPVSLIGMNSEDMSEYIRYVADRLVTELGADPIYNACNPFDWMAMLGLENKTNFFEQRVSEYRKNGVSGGSTYTFSQSDDF
jgi:ribonucleoside-diphosphate reductase beta chain